MRVLFTAKSADQGTSIPMLVHVVSQADLSGGTIEVTTTDGQVVGHTRVTNPYGIATVKVDTTPLEPDTSPHTLHIQYLGNSQTHKSGTVRTTITTRTSPQPPPGERRDR